MSLVADGAHPLCICGPMSFGETKGLVTIEGCRANAQGIYGIDPHPVMSKQDMEEIIIAFRERLGVTA